MPLPSSRKFYNLITKLESLSETLNWIGSKTDHFNESDKDCKRRRKVAIIWDTNPICNVDMKQSYKTSTQLTLIKLLNYAGYITYHQD